MSGYTPTMREEAEVWALFAAQAVSGAASEATLPVTAKASLAIASAAAEIADALMAEFNKRWEPEEENVP